MQTIQQQQFNFDLNIFKAEETPLSPNKCSDIGKCIAIKRLVVGLRYYSLLDDDEDILMEFVNQVYGTQLLEDNNHLIMCQFC